MAGENVTSTGHDLSAARWLDTHFESARSEYEAALRRVGVKRGEAVLDAGCGSGGFLPIFCELVGQGGSVAALDLAPENVAVVESNIRAGVLPVNVHPQVGDVLAPPFPKGVFDRVWCANVAQYLTVSEFARMVAEFRRVAKPGGFITIKEFDSALMQLHPFANDRLARLWAERRKRAASDLIGPWGGTSIPSLLREAGLTDISAKGWLVERWAPPPDATRALLESFLSRWAGLPSQYEALAPDVTFWREVATSPGRILDAADFCYREFFVVTTGRVPEDS
jgi:ubiquinone/menaquinone biosynthesis C-methylase UbiE